MSVDLNRHEGYVRAWARANKGRWVRVAGDVVETVLSGAYMCIWTFFLPTFGVHFTFIHNLEFVDDIGYDLTCGACAELFYTGARLHPHDAGCKTEGAATKAVEVVQS